MGIFGNKDDKEPDFSNLKGGSSSAAAPAATESARTYTVEKGDSLSKIAKEQYGDAGKWRKIYDANRDVVDDPDLIYPGQTLRIPE